MFRRLVAAVLTLSVALPGVASAAEEPGSSFEQVIDEVGRTLLARFPEHVTDLRHARDPAAAR